MLVLDIEVLVVLTFHPRMLAAAHAASYCDNQC